jgi:hypothetical protein
MKIHQTNPQVDQPWAGLPSTGSGRRNFYLIIRKLHLYLGLFISPYVLVFAVSTIMLNHNGKLGEEGDEKTNPRQFVRQIQSPAGAESLEQAKDILRQLGLTGEIGYINHLVPEGKLAFPVMKPGLETQVDFDLHTKTATVEQRRTNFWKRLVYLHKSPGQHNANIRGNWIFTRLWRILVDSVVYVLLFLTTGGVYLWAVIKAERKTGLICLGAGMACFWSIVAALSL